MTWNPTNPPQQFFDRESRAAIEESCKHALTLIRGGAGIDSPELALLLNAMWALANALAQRMLRGQSVNWHLDAVDVADAFIDTVLRAGLPPFNLERPFLPYAQTIIRRLWLEKQRRDKVRHCISLPEQATCCKETCPSNRMTCKESRARVRKAVRELPRKLRHAVIARYWLGLCPKLAAAKFGANVGTFNGWMFRARTILREMLDDEDFDFAV